MAFYLATIFIEVLLDLYIYFFYNNYSYIQMEYYIFNAVTFYMLTSETDKLTNAGDQIALDLMKTRITKLNSGCQKQVLTFMRQLSANRAQASAAGFCAINKGIIVSGNAMADDVAEVPLGSLTEECQQQVQMFLSQIMAKKLQVSASGLCIINKRLIISIVMGVTTFFIAIYQMSQES
ncbi:uncharacterized protein LOC117282696 [Cryptotermes secundus]|uniref:uncharacterized protein LOC117282696 n=1 Tax=Cryptotermes secundus TaxID=105785 RepID=UPI001454DF02|nr:uncharacterized protein LOC117282696 [Cryptotermes secundus]